VRLRIMKLSITTLSLTTLSISILSVTTLSTMTFSIMTLSIMTFSITITKSRHSHDTWCRMLLCWLSFLLTVNLCWVSEVSSVCWVSVNCMSLCWVLLCRVPLCWMSWRPFKMFKFQAQVEILKKFLRSILSWV
jgi:hypothetical protein